MRELNMVVSDVMNRSSDLTLNWDPGFRRIPVDTLPQPTARNTLLAEYARDVRIVRLSFLHKSPGYTPKTDTIGIPSRAEYKSRDRYLFTLFHELGHSTGHRSRLARQAYTVGFAVMFNQPLIAREELTAELFALYQMKRHGMLTPETLDIGTWYVRRWAATAHTQLEDLIKEVEPDVRKAIEYVK